MDTINIQIEYKDIKSMNLRVIDETTVLVRANPRYTKEQIQEFVDGKSDWITKQMWIKKEEKKLRSKGIFILGKNYSVKYIPSNRNECKLGDDVFYVHYQKHTSPDDVLNHGLGKMVRDILTERLTCCMPCFPKLKRPKLTIQSMKSRWGSCKYREGEIVLNAYLIHVPIPCIDYVIIHELMHFYYPDHQAGFHSGMRQALPEYKLRKSRLQEYEFLLRG